jgi:hypothetical protein
MADWQRTIDVTDIWNDSDVHLIATKAAERLEALAPFPSHPEVDERKAELVEELRNFAGDTDATVEDFDLLWRDVYDWADTRLDGRHNGKKVCWIATF